MRGSAAGARAGRVQQAGLLTSPAVVTQRWPMTSPYTNSYHIPPTQNTHTIFHSRRDHPVTVRHYTEKTRKDEVDDILIIYFMVYRL